VDEKGSSKPERIFIGLPVTSDAREAIARKLPNNLPGKQVALDKWHFTLRFLGSTSQAARDSIISRLLAAKLGLQFRVRFGGLGAFPNPRRARVLWLGVTRGGERLSQLAAIAEDAARNAGFARGARAFTPHLTLSRLDPPQSVVELLAQNHTYDVETVVTSLILYRSQLGAGPSRYEEVARFPLDAAR
jgi:RNA 2',3'-cyclic 3'-phosphodiesterase